jgi:hypothetical protein
MDTPRLTITCLPNPRRIQVTDLIVRSSTGMVIAFDGWPSVLRLLEQETPDESIRVSVRVATPLTAIR